MQFNNIPNGQPAKGYAGYLTDSGNVVSKNYNYDSDSDRIIAALDIDWCGAEVDENKVINTTGELLSWIKEGLTADPGDKGQLEQADWNQSDTGANDYIKNKPTIPTSLSQLSGDATHRTVTDTEKTTWNNKSNFSGNYNDLINKPVLAKVATSGSYNDLNNKPAIPTVPSNVSAFINDAGYLTSHQNISNKADKATTLEGYGITDGYTKTEGQTLESEVDSRLDSQDEEIATLRNNNVVTVNDHLTVTDPDSQVIYREPENTTPPTYYIDWMYQDSAWKQIQKTSFPGIDDEPIVGSENLVKSGGVYQELEDINTFVNKLNVTFNGVAGSYTDNIVVKLYAGRKYAIRSGNLGDNAHFKDANGTVVLYLLNNTDDEFVFPVDIVKIDRLLGESSYITIQSVDNITPQAYIETAGHTNKKCFNVFVEECYLTNFADYDSVRIQYLPSNNAIRIYVTIDGVESELVVKSLNDIASHDIVQLDNYGYIIINKEYAPNGSSSMPSANIINAELNSNPRIKDYLDYIEVDEYPIAGSENLVKSGGVYQELEDINTFVNKLNVTFNGVAGSYTDNIAVKLYAGRKYAIRSGNLGGNAQLKDTNGNIIYYVQNNTNMEFVFPVDIVKIDRLFGESSYITIQSVDNITLQAYIETAGHTNEKGFNVFVEECYLVNFADYDSVRIQYIIQNNVIRLYATTDGVESELVVKSLNDIASHDIVQLDSYGYIIFNKEYAPNGSSSMPSANIINAELNSNPRIKDYLDYIKLNSEVAKKLDIKPGKNLYNGNYLDGQLLSQSGSLIPYREDWVGIYGVSEFIPFGENNYIAISGQAIAGSGTGFYDENKQYLSGSRNTASSQVYEKPSDSVKYIRFSLKLSEDIQIEYSRRNTDYQKYSEIGGYVENMYPQTITITANSDTNSDADFVGNDAIQKAIDSITDASTTKKYIIECTGEFVAKLPSDYHYQAGTNQYSLIWPKSYVSLDGLGNGNCVIRGELPQSLADCQADTPAFTQQDYRLYQPAFISHGGNLDIKNITFISRNSRYPLHIDCSNSVASRNKTINIENCNIINEGKYGDSVGTTGESASGIGMSSGQKLVFKNCYFEANSSGLYYHDNANFTKKSTIIFEDCILNQKENVTQAQGVSIGTINNPVGSDIIINNTNLNETSYIGFNVTSKTTERADCGNVRMISNMEPMPLYYSSEALGLKVTSLSEASSSVRFDKDSSAFDAIVGYSEKTILKTRNVYGFQEQYGYEWQDGGDGYSAFAVGFRNLEYSSLGARLGDCSGTSKTLGIIIDGITYNVVFNQDFTSSTNDDVLEVINAVISPVGTASTYKVNRDWYPTKMKGLKYAKVKETSILRGMGLKFVTDGVVKATASDEKIDAIALDNGVNGENIRVITCGKLNFDNAWRYGLSYDFNTRYWDMTDGTLLGIGTTDGVFTRNASHPTVQFVAPNGVKFL